MVSFNVGDLVIPVVNIPFNGEIIPTAGASGTVLSRKLIGRNTSEENIYTYEVDMAEDYPAVSGTMILSNFWFDESQLEGGSNETQPLLDLNLINNNINTAKDQASMATNRVMENLNSMNPLSPYHDAVSGLKSSIDSISSTIFSKNIDMSSASGILETASVANESALHLGSNVVLLSEVSDNLKGYHDAIAIQDEERSQAKKQADEQEAKARQDDALNAKVYYDTYINAAPYRNLLVPQSDTIIPSTEPDELIPSMASLILDQGDD